jgi:uncharacterized membrane protein YbhN (UPF0104 family)
MIKFFGQPKAWFIKVMLSIVLLAIIIIISGIEGIGQSLSQFPFWLLIIFMLLLLCNIFVVSFRFWILLAHYGFSLPLAAVTRANISGLSAGLLVISLFGHVVGRQAILRRFGLRPVAIASLTAYERVIVTIISALFCFSGAVFLLGQSVVYEFFDKFPVFQMLVVICGGVTLSLWLGRSRLEAQLVALIKSKVIFLRVIQIVGITIISQVLLLGTFVLAFMTIAPDVEIINLVAAAAIISFAASLPISIGGWGIRELTAVFVLGQLGVAAANAIAASVLVGLLATFAIVVLTPFSFKKAPDVTSTSARVINMPAINVEKSAAWILSMAMAVLVFFQVHLEVPIWHGEINLNLADPFAILALAAVSFAALSTRSPPIWRLKQFNVILIAISVLVTFSFLNGVLEIGVTQWALASRLLGWLVLLGYVSGGYLIVMYAGNHGLRRMSETMISIGVAIIIVTIISRFLSGVEWLPEMFVTVNFEGFAANRNAFAFQILVCMVLLLAYSSMRTRAYPLPPMTECKALLRKKVVSIRSLIFPVLLGVIMLGIFLSASRAGMLVGIFILFVVWGFKLADRRVVVLGIIFATLMWGTITIPIQESAQGSTHIQSGYSGDASNMERMKSISMGLDMWLQSPLIGAGLGVFTETKSDLFGRMMVIHSTPVWILAEFGIVGILVLGWVFFLLMSGAFHNKEKLPAYRGALLLLIAFSIFCLVHEVFYQRIFWLVLGALLACPGKMASIESIRQKFSSLPKTTGVCS